MNTELRQLQDMRQAAYSLGMGFARTAEVVEDLELKLKLFEAFQAGFASVRLSNAMEMRLQATSRIQPERAQPVRTERSVSAGTPAPAERPERDVERERDRETVSLPRLLRTLTRVADDAQALMPEAAELPALREGLDRVYATPTPRRTPTSPRPSGALRTRLSGGTASPPLTSAPKPALPDLPGLPRRRATGPPKR